MVWCSSGQGKDPMHDGNNDLKSRYSCPNITLTHFTIPDPICFALREAPIALAFGISPKEHLTEMK